MTGWDGIQGLGEPQRPRLMGEGVAPQRGEAETQRGSFGDALASSLSEVHGLAEDARSKAEAMARGEPVEAHEVMIAAQKSEVAFNLALEIRNKLLDAWQRLSQSVT